MGLTPEELQNRFTYHAPKEGQPQKYEILRSTGKELAEKIRELCPESRERDFAVERLEEAIMWANASIARHGK